MNIEINSSDIIKMLPHKYPILLVDKVTNWNEKSIETLKVLTINEQIFQGHFPGAPILPGIYMIEMAAQSAALMYILDYINPNSIKDFHKKINTVDNNVKNMVGYLGSIKNVKFQNLAFPGDILKIHIKEIMSASNVREILFKLNNQNKKIICEGKMMVTQNESNC